MHVLKRSVLLLASLSAAACTAGSGNEVADTGSADSAAGLVVADTGIPSTPAKDANHEFLRMMSDHHEGLVRMAEEAMSKASSTTTQGDAHQLHTKQMEDQKKMVAMVQQQYDETHIVKTMPQHARMIADLQGKSGSEYDRTFYRHVVEHHKEGISMTDQMLPNLKGEVRRMAETMKAAQQKEIAEFEKKMK
jgi:uncharacterized protein (DUF305 family)